MDYENTVEVAEAFAGFEDRMSPDQAGYFDLLCTLIADWERDRVQWPEASGVALLEHLAESAGLTGADISRILGASSRHLGPMILRGERSITAEHARRLGAHFRLDPGAFLKL